MTAPKGTPAFSSVQSKETEKKHRQIVKEIVEDFSDLSLEKEISLDEIVGEENVIYGRQLNGSPSKTKPDGGVLYYRGEPAGFMESKYQKNTQNAIERVNKLSTDLQIMGLPPMCLFVSAYGPGFTLQEKATSTGPQIDRFRALGVTCLENPTDKEFREEFRAHVVRLMSKLEDGTIQQYRRDVRTANARLFGQ